MSSHEAETTASPSIRRMCSAAASAAAPPAWRISWPRPPVMMAAPTNPMVSCRSPYHSATAAGASITAPKIRTITPQTWTTRE